MAPETIVAAVAQKVNWKKKKLACQNSSLEKSATNQWVSSFKPSCAPNMMPNPNSQKSMAATIKSNAFLSATLIAFLLRVRPDSRQRNPPCIIKTSMAAINNHNVSSALISGIDQSPKMKTALYRCERFAFAGDKAPSCIVECVVRELSAEFVP